ncbi:MAG: bifunctional hydroxymethylpyrimidine kinase/phosphomethylpyrimidine kinase, partial [Nocardioidaceae bacterium]
RLLEPAAESLYVESLLPHVRMLTPNLREAEVLLGTPIRCLAEQREAARALGALGPAVIVIKGGHPVSDSSDQAIDVVWDGTSAYDLSAPRVDTVNNHGTGCTFAAAAAAAMADGAEPAEALQTAKDYVSLALSRGASWQLGHGHGPLDHFTGSHR